VKHSSQHTADQSKTLNIITLKTSGAADQYHKPFNDLDKCSVQSPESDSASNLPRNQGSGSSSFTQDSDIADEINYATSRLELDRELPRTRDIDLSPISNKKRYLSSEAGKDTAFHNPQGIHRISGMIS
jgi:hypothetical protein